MERLSLTPYAEADRASFVAWFTDPRFMAFIGGAMGPSEAETLFDALLVGRHPSVRASFAVRSTGTLVGHGALLDVEGSDAVEVTYGLAPEWWGRGLGRPLAALLVAHAWSTRVSSVEATVDLENTRSIQILKSFDADFRVCQDEEGAYGRFVFVRASGGVASFLVEESRRIG